MCPVEWTKINQQENGVAWGARDDSHGEWQVASRICGRKLKLQHRSGSVGNSAGTESNFGSSSDYVCPHVTVGKGSAHAVVPYAGDPKVNTAPGNGWYFLSGFNAMSPYLEFDLPLTNEESYYCFEEGTEYHLWYGEDMNDWTEEDNSGTVYTDILITS